MADYTIPAGATSRTLFIKIRDSAVATNAGKTGLAFGTASLEASYVRPGGVRVAITLATLAAVNSAWSSGGFKEVDSTHMPGIYRFDAPDAMIADGVNTVTFTFRGAAGMMQEDFEIQLTEATAAWPSDSRSRM